MDKNYNMSSNASIDRDKKRKLLKQLLIERGDSAEKCDIAIVGLSGRYPDSETLDVFWENLKHGKSCISQVPKDRWDWKYYSDSDAGERKHSYSKWGGFIKDADKFDPLFFQISPKEAEEMDPQERVFLETAWSVLEDAGIPRKSLSGIGNRVGVFVGVMNNYYTRQGGNSVYWSIANRVSYYFNFQGPSMAVDTACSSSLTAIHLACESIKRGECAAAIAGGVNLILHPDHFINLCRANMLSKVGKCSTFGVEADGFVDGEGVGAVFLKPLDAAIANGDRIYGVIKATSINAGGKTSGFTVPNPTAQAEVIKNALKRANINPRTISYMEAHGTGTSLGDPIEIAGLTRVFGEYTRDQQYCAIGSVKTNIGHLESAAGIAGLTKVLLQMKYKKLVPSINSEILNSQIDFLQSPFHVQHGLEDWNQPVIFENDEEKVYLRRAGLSSFGAGGANAHIIIEEYQEKDITHSYEDIEPQAIVLSAKSDERLKAYVGEMLDFLLTHTRSENMAGDVEELHLTDIAYTLQNGREEMEERLVVIASDVYELIKILKDYFDGSVEQGKLFKGSIYDHRGTDSSVGDEYIQDCINGRDLTKLAQLWTRGVNVDWSKLHEKERARRVSLPTYPFARDRFWVDYNVRTENTQDTWLHPLVWKNISTLNEERFIARFDGNEFFMADHKVEGRRVLPAAAILEMVQAAGAIAGEEKVGIIRDVVWARPVVVENSEVTDVNISLYLENQSVDFELWSNGNDDERFTHAQGKLVYESKCVSIQNTTGSFDIEKVKSRCKYLINENECYSLFEKAGLDYGISFRSIKALYVGQNEALSMVELPSVLEETVNEFNLHPSIIDGVLQTVIGMVYSDMGSFNGAYLPFSIGEIEIFEKLQHRVYAYIQLNNGQNQDTNEIKRFDLKVIDEDGKELIRIKNFAVKAFSLSSSKLESTGENTAKVICYQFKWTEKEIDADKTIGGLQRLLVFDDDRELFNTIKQLKDTKYGKFSKAMLVMPGDTFKSLGEGIYTTNPAKQDDYRMLIEELETNDIMPTEIIHFWGQTRNYESSEEISECLERGIFSMIYLTRALMKCRLKNKIKLLYAAREKDGVINPFNSGMAGFLKTVALENPMLDYKIAAFDAANFQYNELVDLIMNEFQSTGKENYEIRYKGNKRYVKEIRELDTTEDSEDTITLRDKGAYIITGGTGGLGIIFARYLSEKTKSSIVLVGRSSLDAKKKAILHELNSSGANVVYYEADTSNYDDVVGLISSVKSRFRNIYGIIHSAGVIKDSLLLKKTDEEIKQVLAPKIFGTLWLDKATINEPLDFFTVFSSISSIFGSAGQADYAFANSFLDSFSEVREELRKVGKRKGNTLSINWPLWKDGGMGMDEEARRWMKKTMALEPLAQENGIKTFEFGLKSGLNQLMVLEGDPNRIKLALRGRNQVDTDEPKASGIEYQDKTKIQEKVEEYLKKVLSNETKLQVSKIIPHEPFEKYGVDSVMVMHMTRALEKDFGELTKTLFFEYQNIKELAAYLADNHAQSVKKLVGEHSETKLKIQESPMSEKQVDAKSIQRFFTPTAKKERNKIKEEEIAIVGLSGRYPMADSLEEFWEILKQGKDCIVEIPEDRWNYKEYYSPDKNKSGKSYSIWGGFMNNVDKFDPLFFNISPKEARYMDPQERLFLETVWHTIEDAGYTKKSVDNLKVGLFVGVMYSQYQLLGLEESLKGNFTSAGSSYASIANRISYYFNFRGPSIALDTMCSSSLTAIHLACASILRGECEMAVAGGVNVSIHPNKYIQLSEGNFASSDGRCRSFGEGGDGYVPGEGVGAVLLKPLSRAISSGDHIYAVIKGSSLNHGGKTNGYTIPNPNAQGELILDALENAGVNPREISYLEAHGTGTALGDPIEITGLMKAYRADTLDTQFCSIGSVKSNIGHLESAAGIAGLTKILLQMKYRRLVPSIHSKDLNKNINFKESPFYVQHEFEEWKQPVIRENGIERKVPRIAGISSFGAGGANAHIILQEYNFEALAPAIDDESTQIIVLSARNEERLKVYAGMFVEFIDRINSTGCEKACDRDILSSLKKDISDIVANVTGVDSRELFEDENLYMEYGIDAVTFNAVKTLITAKYNIEENIETIDQFNTIEAISHFLYGKFTELINTYYGDPVNSPKQQEKNNGGLRLSDIAYTLQDGREAMEERLAIIAENMESLRGKLQEYCCGKTGGEGIFTGNTGRNASKKSLLVDDEDVKEIISKWFAKGKLNKVAEAWVEGLNIDWNLVERVGVCKRVSLPVYPFAKDRYWIEKTNSQLNNLGMSTISPLIDRVVPKMCLDHNGVVFSRSFKASEEMLRDHKVGGQSVLPGVGYLEMVFEALSYLNPDKSYSLSGVVWLQPVLVGDENREVLVVIKKADADLKFEILSSSGSKDIVHSMGNIIQIKNINTTAQRLSVKDIKSKCTHMMANGEFYNRFASMGIIYGPFFKPIEQVWGNPREALGSIRLPDGLEKETGRYIFHPSIMDGALQTVAGVVDGAVDSKTAMLPFSVDEIQLMKPFNKRGYTYVQTLGEGRFNIAVLDDAGFVCLKLYEFTVRAATAKAVEENNALSQDFLYAPGWRHADLSPEDKSQNTGTGRTLIVYSADGAYLKKAIEESAGTQDLYGIELGTSNIQRSESDFEVDANDSVAIAECISKIEGITDIYYLGGINKEISCHDSLEKFDLSQEMGVLGLFRLVKALSNAGANNYSVRIKVVTNNVYKILKYDTIIPYAASLHGFVRSMAKEYSKWEISCIDLDLSDSRQEIYNSSIDGLVASILSEPGDPKGETVAIRGGRRYIRTMNPVVLPPVQAVPFKREGVYMILGGAGGIGLELSAHLSESVKANIVLLGRSALKDEQLKRIAEIERLGGKVHYIRADAVDLKSMKSAVSEAKAKFAKINGVIHSAIVLKDKTIENMNEQTLKDVLAPKVRGTVVLYEALKEEKLDFMMFFSSAQSFTGNPGQSNYASACTFKDAYAHYIKNLGNYPVKIINWGYWGSVGIVASEEYNKKLAAMGIQSINPEEGMDTVEKILSSNVEQVIAMKAAPKLMEMIGVDFKQYIEVFNESQLPLLDEAILSKKAPIIDENVLGRSRTGFNELQRFGRSVLLHSLRRMSVFIDENERYDKKSLKSWLGIVEQYSRLYDAILEYLANGEFIDIDGNEITAGRMLKNKQFVNELSCLEDKKTELMVCYPELKVHINLLWICLENYPSILRGERNATDIIFPDTSMELVEGIYKNNVVADYFNSLIVWSIQSYLEHRLKTLPENEKINIIEVGAGTGGTSALIFEGIRQYGEKIKYYYTDISAGFTQYGKKQYGKMNPFIEFKLLNIENEISGQGYEPGTFDIVVATNVLHATKDISNTLRNIKMLLKSNGWVVINEETDINEFATLTFGLLEGWWLYNDGENRLHASPLLSVNVWERLLAEEGFERIVVLGPEGNASKGLGQNVIIGEGNGMIKTIRHISKEVKAYPSGNTNGKKVPEITSGDNTQIPAAIKKEAVVMREISIEHVEVKKKHIKDIIIDNLVKTLEVKTSEINLEKQFSEYGVDSITGLELIKKINEAFSISLKTTALFDYGNVSDLSDYIYKVLYGNENSNVHYSSVEPEKYYTDNGHSHYDEPFMEKRILNEYDNDTYLAQNDKPAVKTEDTYDTRLFIEEKIIENIIRTLEVNSKDINLEKQFSEYGVDSITGLELIKNINSQFGISLKTTALFDYGNVKDLADFIFKEYRDLISGGLSIDSKDSTQVLPENMPSNPDVDSELDLLIRLASGKLDAKEAYRIMEGM